VFKVGNSNSPSTWAGAPAPSDVVVLPGGGTHGSDRILVLWPDNAIQNQWLQVTVLANGRTGLAVPDVFYFGNAIGESGNDPANTVVDQQDEVGARTHPTGFAPALMDNPFDFNRDGRVNATDALIARHHPSGLDPLQLITAPAGAGLRGTSLARASTPGLTGAKSWPQAMRADNHIEGLVHDAVLQNAARPEPTGNGALSAKWAWLYDLEQLTARPQSSKKEGRLSRCGLGPGA
jgi:hypothetical protein